jgi:hypothetical protein
MGQSQKETWKKILFYYSIQQEPQEGRREDKRANMREERVP